MVRFVHWAQKSLIHTDNTKIPFQYQLRLLLRLLGGI